MWRILLLLSVLCSPASAQQSSPDQVTSDTPRNGEFAITAGGEDTALILDQIRSILDYYSREVAKQQYSNDLQVAATQIARSDLDEQKRMAAATDWLNTAAWVGLIFTFCGLVLLGGTLYFTRNAATDTRHMLLEAKKATIAAEASAHSSLRASGHASESNALARESMQRQLRAYITIDAIEIPGASQTSYRYHFKIHFSNTGQTPANFVRIGFKDLLLREPKSSIKMEAWKRTRPQWITIGTIGGNTRNEYREFDGEVSLSHLTQTSTHLSRSAVYATGVIEYIDIFGDHQSTKFVWKVWPLSCSAKICDFGNNAT